MRNAKNTHIPIQRLESFSEKESAIAKKEFSKGIFKTAFFFCIFFDPAYINTSIIEIGGHLKEVIKNKEKLSNMNEFFEEALIFRIAGQYKSDFIGLRKNFILFVFFLLKNGDLHKKMDYHEMIKYFTNIFSGFPYLIQEVKKSIITD